MNLNKRVEALLEADQRFRDSDKLLLMAVWHKQGFVLTPEQRNIFMERCNTAESITRARRNLRAKYPASKAVTDARFEKYKTYRGGDFV